MQKVVKPWKCGAKDHAGKNYSLVTAGKCNASGSQSLVVQSGDAKNKNPVKANEQRLDVAKQSNHGPKKLNLQTEGNGHFATGRKANKDVPLSDSETGSDKTSYGFGGLIRSEQSGSLTVIHAGQAKKKKAVQTKDIGADKPKSSTSSRSGLGGVDEVKEQQPAAKGMEPCFDVVKETNNGPKWHAKCKASGICSGLWWGRANSRPVDRELMVCQLNRNPADYDMI